MCGDIILIRSRRYGENRIQDAEVFIPQISEESLHLFQPHRARLRYWSFWVYLACFGLVLYHFWRQSAAIL